MKIPVAEIREGCGLLIERIRRHADDARVLWNAGRYPGAFLLVLLGFEELGKLLEYIQTAATAERTEVPEAEVVDFRDPGPRAAKAAHIAKASLSSEYLQRGLHLVAWAMRVVGLPEHLLGTYDDHLRVIGTDFDRLRGTSMYVDYVAGTWTRGKPVNPESVESDIVALEVVATLIEGMLNGYKTFSEVVDVSIALEREMRQKLPEVIRAIIKGIVEQLKSGKQ